MSLLLQRPAQWAWCCSAILKGGLVLNMKNIVGVFLFNRGYFILSRATTGNIPSEFLLSQDNLELDPGSKLTRSMDQVSANIPSSQENNDH
jgi:hypothetical protein